MILSDRHRGVNLENLVSVIVDKIFPIKIFETGISKVKDIMFDIPMLYYSISFLLKSI